MNGNHLRVVKTFLTSADHSNGDMARLLSEVELLCRASGQLPLIHSVNP